MRERLRWSYFQLSVAALLAFSAGGCLESGNAPGQKSSGAPIACLEHIVQSRYRAWKKKNTRAIEDLKALAARNRWKLLVACGNSVKTLDLFSSERKTVYSTKNRICYAALQPGGEVALIERKSGVTSRHNEYFVVVLEGKRELLRITLREEPVLSSYLGGNPVLVTRDYVIFPDGSNIILYSLQDEKERVLFKGRKGSHLLTVRETGGLLYLVMVDYRRDPARSEMVVLTANPPFEKIHSLSCVTNLIVVGENLLLERNGEIVRYCPETKQTEFLEEGTLLAAVNSYKFLFATSSWQINKLGLLALDFVIKEYKLSAGESREVAGKFSIDTCYGVTYPLVSPDSQHVLVADNTKSVLVDSEYLVYNIESGEKAGAFYEPYSGRHYFNHVLGWVY